MSESELLDERTAAPTDRRVETIRRWLPWVVAAALFMEHLDATIVNTAVPTIASSLGVSPLSLKGLLASYTLSLAVFIPISGWMADRWGTRRVFAAAIVVFLLGSICCGISSNVPALILSRILQGMGGAMMMPVGRLTLVRTFPRSEMIVAMNYVIIPALIGPLIGPSLGGAIVHWLHWRIIFLINIPIALMGLYLVHRFMPDYRKESPAPLDFRGFLLFGSGTALISYVIEVFWEHVLPYSTLAVLALLSFGLVGGYWAHSRRTPHPMFDLDVFRVRTFRLAVMGGFITRLGIGGMPFLLPLLYQVGLGFAPWQAGLLTVPQAIAAMSMKAYSRYVLRRFGHRSVLMANTVLLGGTISLFALVDRGTPIPALLLLSFAQGFVSSLQFTSMNSLVFADVSDAEASNASSISSTAQQLSLSFGVAFASLIAELFLANVNREIANQVLPALHQALMVMGVLTAVSSVSFWGLHTRDGSAVSQYKPAEKS
ncbi:MAG: MFS transporter [Candidatus Hydrogenedentota bacterium]